LLDGHWDWLGGGTNWDWLAGALCCDGVAAGNGPLCCDGVDAVGGALCCDGPDGAAGPVCCDGPDGATGPVCCDGLGASGGGTGFLGQAVLLWPISLHTTHLLRIPPFRNAVSSFFSSQGSNLLFFLGLPGIILLIGGRTSGYAVTSHNWWPLIG